MHSSIAVFENIDLGSDFQDIKGVWLFWGHDFLGSKVWFLFSHTPLEDLHSEYEKFFECLRAVIKRQGAGISPSYFHRKIEEK